MLRVGGLERLPHPQPAARRALLVLDGRRRRRRGCQRHDGLRRSNRCSLLDVLDPLRHVEDGREDRCDALLRQRPIGAGRSNAWISRPVMRRILRERPGRLCESAHEVRVRRRRRWWRRQRLGGQGGRGEIGGRGSFGGLLVVLFRRLQCGRRAQHELREGRCRRCQRRRPERVGDHRRWRDPAPLELDQARWRVARPEMPERREAESRGAVSGEATVEATVQQRCRGLKRVQRGQLCPGVRWALGSREVDLRRLECGRRVRRGFRARRGGGWGGCHRPRGSWSGALLLEPRGRREAAARLRRALRRAGMSPEARPSHLSPLPLQFLRVPLRSSA
jgi:hypothetical protein